MKKLIQTLVEASNAYPELDSFRDALFQVLEIEMGDTPVRVALGFGSSFVEISPDKVDFVSGSDRISVGELARMRSLAEDISQRLLLPYTEGTDEAEDVDSWVDGSPTMPNTIVGGFSPQGGGEIDDGQISPTTTWSSTKIDLGLSGKLNAAGLQFGGSKPSSPTNGFLWFESLGFDSPWEWNNALGLWLSPVRQLILPVATYAISSQSNMRCDHPLLLPDSTHGIYIRNIQRTGVPVGSAHSSTNNWAFQFGWWDGTANSVNAINSFTTSGYTSANSIYRSNTTNHNTNYQNPFGLYVSASKNGTPGAVYMSFVIDYRISRT